eukprot:699242-Amphidinium_carterae.1
MAAWSSAQQGSTLSSQEVVCWNCHTAVAPFGELASPLFPSPSRVISSRYTNRSLFARNKLHALRFCQNNLELHARCSLLAPIRNSLREHVTSLLVKWSRLPKQYQYVKQLSACRLIIPQGLSHLTLGHEPLSVQPGQQEAATDAPNATASHASHLSERWWASSYRRMYASAPHAMKRATVVCPLTYNSH